MPESVSAMTHAENEKARQMPSPYRGDFQYKKRLISKEVLVSPEMPLPALLH